MAKRMRKRDTSAGATRTTSSKSRDPVRLQLIQQVQSGAMTPEDAEADAERLGIAPLIAQPDPAQFDPMNEVVWTLPMVAAWLAFKDVDAVRAWSPAYRSQLREWQPRFCTVTERFLGRDLVKAQSATLLNMAIAYELDDNGIPPVSITAVMQCVKAAGMNGGLRATTGISTRTGERRAITRDEWQDLEYKQIGFETNARDALRMKADGKWLEHGFDAVTLSRHDVLSGLPAPGATAEQDAADVALEKPAGPYQQCEQWLVGLMRDGGKKQKIKTEYRDEAMKEFGIGWRSFDRAWDHAVNDTHSKWGKPGRRSQRGVS